MRKIGVVGEPNPSAVVAPVSFADVREFQAHFEGMITQGSCFIMSARPLASDLPVVVKLTVNGIGTADLSGTIDYNDVDSQGRPGQVVKLTPDAVTLARALYEKCLGGPSPAAAAPVGEVAAPVLPFPSVVAPPAPSPQPVVEERPADPPPPPPAPPPAPVAPVRSTQVVPIAELLAQMPSSEAQAPGAPVVAPAPVLSPAAALAALYSTPSSVEPEAAPTPPEPSAGGGEAATSTQRPAPPMPVAAPSFFEPRLEGETATPAENGLSTGLSSLAESLAEPPGLTGEWTTPPELAAALKAAAASVGRTTEGETQPAPAAPDASTATTAAFAAAPTAAAPTAAAPTAAAPTAAAPTAAAPTAAAPTAAAPTAAAPTAAAPTAAAPTAAAPTAAAPTAAAPTAAAPTAAAPTAAAPTAAAPTAAAPTAAAPTAGAAQAEHTQKVVAAESARPESPDAKTLQVPAIDPATVSTPAEASAPAPAALAPPPQPAPAVASPVVPPPLAAPQPPEPPAGITGAPLPVQPGSITSGTMMIRAGATVPAPAAPAPPSQQTGPVAVVHFGAQHTPAPPPEHFSATPAPVGEPVDLSDTRVVKNRPIEPSAPRPGTSEMPALRPDESQEERLAPGTLLDNRFQIESHLASGGMGDVYRAAHVYLKRPIALKLLKRGFATDPDMWARFQREAELVSQLESPHIVRVFDFGRTSAGQAFLAMEFVQGVTLDAMVQKEGPLAADRAVALLAQVCEGLNEAHAMGVIHRDLKPPNIIVGKRRDGSEIAKILDFGIARIADSHQKTGGMLTQMGMVVGTPAYLAPEQALADTLDARTDIYALGCVAFTLLTGRPPFVADDLQKLIAQHIHEAPPKVASLRKDLDSYPALEETIQKALAKDRAMRFQDVKAFAEALRSSLKTTAVPSAFDDWAAEAVVGTPVDQEAPAAPPAKTAAATNTAPAPADDWSEAPPEGDAWSEDAPAASPAPEPKAAPAAASKAPAGAGAGASAFYLSDEQASAVSPGLHRLGKALKDLNVELPAELLEQVVERRSSLESGTRKMVVLHVEALRANTDAGQRARCLKHIVALGLENEGTLDAIDEDGVTMVFNGEDAMIPAARAAFAVLCAREALANEVVPGHESAPPTVRAAFVHGRVECRQDDVPLEGEIVLRARTLAARAPAGKLLAERALASDIDDVTELATSSLGSDVIEVTDRKVQLKSPAQLMYRETHFQTLDKRLSMLATGLVPPLIVTGDAGAGKSALAMELAVRGRAQQVLVAMARGLPSMQGQPYAGIAELLCHICAIPKEQRLTRLGPALEAMKVPAPELEAALVIAGVRHVSQPFTAGQAAYALRAVLSVGHPGRKVLLVFDGLHAMDSFTVDCFRELVAKPVMREMTVGFTTGSFARDTCPSTQTIDLPPFGAPEVGAFVAAHCNGVRPGEKLVELLLRRSQGLPGSLVDWLHLLADKGMLRARSGAIVMTGEAPELNDEELAAARVKAAWPAAARLFEAACLMGDAIDGSVLTAVLPQTPQGAYQRLANSKLLRALGNRRWAVASERYRSVALANPGPHRPMLHQRLAQVMIELARATNTAPDAEQIAQHLTRANDATRALQLWRSVVETALSRRNPRDVLNALRGWGNALAVLLQSPNASAEIARARVETLARAAANALAAQEPMVARALLDEAQGLAQQRKIESAELSLVLARVLRSEARRARATEMLEFAIKKSANAPLQALCLVEKAEALEAEGNLAGAVAAFQQAIAAADTAQDLARWHGELDFKARIYTRLGAALFANKELPKAQQAWTTALAEWRKTGYPYAESRVLSNLGTLYVQSRSLEDAASCFKESSVCASRAGDLLFQARSLINLAKVAKRFDAKMVVKQACDAAKRLCIAVNWEDGKKQIDGIAAG